MKKSFSRPVFAPGPPRPVYAPDPPRPVSQFVSRRAPAVPLEAAEDTNAARASAGASDCAAPGPGGAGSSAKAPPLFLRAPSGKPPRRFFAGLLPSLTAMRSCCFSPPPGAETARQADKRLRPPPPAAPAQAPKNPPPGTQAPLTQAPRPQASPPPLFPATVKASKSNPASAADKPKAKPGPPSAAGPRFALVFFDGVCNLCVFFVHFVLKRDKKGIFRFAPLQGETAARWGVAKDSFQLLASPGPPSEPTQQASLENLQQNNSLSEDADIADASVADSSAARTSSKDASVAEKPPEGGARPPIEKAGKTLVLLREGRVFRGFSAVQEIFCLLYPRASWILKRIPGKRLYQIIALSRYSLFGRKKALYRPDIKSFLP